jgi:hypothetical protein
MRKCLGRSWRHSNHVVRQKSPVVQRANVMRSGICAVYHRGHGDCL